MEELLMYIETLSIIAIVKYIAILVLIIVLIEKFFELVRNSKEINETLDIIKQQNDIIIKQNNQTNMILINADKKNNTPN